MFRIKATLVCYGMHSDTMGHHRSYGLVSSEPLYEVMLTHDMEDPRCHVQKKYQ